MLRLIASTSRRSLGSKGVQFTIVRSLNAQTTPLVLKDKSKPLRIERDLPDPTKDRFKNRIQLGLFAVAITVSLACIFNYEKTQSPIVSNSLYHMRRSQAIRDLMGDSIDFDGLVPWVYGNLNQVAGKVNISFYIRGSKDVQGIVKLVADRENKHQEFLIHDWSVSVGDETIDLLAEGGTRTL
ncbi:LANO_0H24894g1_1 [Lachancea nothofagi CBS 11611]|uniref:LANO_0H24894g1_1 n=1 Tax=Lachancea nothofagi CBS 11611 TaxID=1266666 RepID=A0A1G4KNU5_9SACH|nr:LANO_0H24894g1_1 [Lachancea nothofagi CBS 11611]